MSKRARLTTVAVALTAAAAIPGAALASASGEAAEDEAQIVGPALEQASTAALSHLGGGRVTETEVGDEESYYEVEVTLDDGTEVDVQLDEAFQVVGSETDAPGED